MRIFERYVITFCIYLVVVGSLAAPVVAQSSNTITGFVFAPDRAPLEDISVELQDEFYRLVGRVRTDRSGRYIFSRLNAGRYFVKIFPIGTPYGEQTGEVEIVNIIQRSTESFQKDFYLRDKKSDRPTQRTVGIVFAQDVPAAAKKFYENATGMLNDVKKQAEVTDALLKAIEIFPDYYSALEKLATHYIKLNNFQNAEKVAVKAVSVNPKGYESWYALGYADFQLKKYPEAVEALQNAVNLNPASVNGFFLLGVSMRHVGKYSDSEANFLKAKKLATAPVAEIHWQLALLYTNNLKNYPAAIKELELFLQASPNYAERDKVLDLIKKLKAKDKA